MPFVSMIDVLAVVRPDVDAEVILIGFRGGVRHAIAIREVVRGDDYRMHLERNGDGAIRATLHSNVAPVPGGAVTSLQAVTFAEFVGMPSVTGST